MRVVSRVASVTPMDPGFTPSATRSAATWNCGAYTVGGMRCEASAAPCAGSAATMATAMPVAMAAATAASWLAMDLSRSLPSRLSLTPMASSRALAKGGTR